jgi:hypothetical protein
VRCIVQQQVVVIAKRSSNSQVAACIAQPLGTQQVHFLCIACDCVHMGAAVTPAIGYLLCG